jgi:hypothetical protein
MRARTLSDLVPDKLRPSALKPRGWRTEGTDDFGCSLSYKWVLWDDLTGLEVWNEGSVSGWGVKRSDGETVVREKYGEEGVGVGEDVTGMGMEVAAEPMGNGRLREEDVGKRMWGGGCGEEMWPCGQTQT